jgi:predicted nuclease of predicted toxin-antitoxin system
MRRNWRESGSFRCRRKLFPVRFKVDENLPSEVIALLADAGHDAKGVLDQFLGGATDAQLAELCRVEGRIVVTLDLDFADIRTYPPAQFPGFVVFRLASQDKQHVLLVASRLAELLRIESPEGRLWVVEEERVRIRE